MIARRLVLLFSIVFCGSLALAAAAVAAGGGGGLAPGQYSFTDYSANAFFGGGKGGPPTTSYSIFVNRGLNSFRAEDSEGSDHGTVIQSTMVQLTQIDPSGLSSFGCFIIPDGDFVVAGNLKSASLHTLLSNPNCPGIGAPVGAAPAAGPKPSGGGGLILPIKLDITWTAPGVIATSHDRFTFSCLDHSENGTNTLRDSVGGTATGSVGTTTGLLSPGSDITQQNGTLEVQGAVQPPCFGK